MPDHEDDGKGRDEGRDVVVVDLETIGLDPQKHFAVEAAWWNLATGENGSFVPVHSVQEAQYFGDPEALRINGYVDRLQHAEQDHGNVELTRLYWQLEGNTLAGANPTFDAGFLTRMFQWLRVGDTGEKTWAKPQPWHHRLPDLATYAAGALRTPLGQLAGLSDVCARLGVENLSPHTAAGDVHATGECFLAIEAYCGQIDELVEDSRDLLAQGEELPEAVVRLLELLQSRQLVGADH